MFKKQNGIVRTYGEVFQPSFILLYGIYFLFFFFNHAFENSISLFFVSAGLKEKFYSVFLTTVNVLDIILPGLISILANKHGAYKFAYLGIGCSVVGAFTMTFSEKGIIVLSMALVLFAGRTLFNFSFGNKVNLDIDNNKRGKYFVMRDLFLFGGSSLGLLVGGMIVEKTGIKSYYRYFAFGFIMAFAVMELYRRQMNKKMDGRVEHTENNHLSEKPNIKSLLKEKTVIAYLFINIFSTFYYTSWKFLPLLGLQLGIDVPHVMSIFGFTALVNSILSIFLAQFSDKKGRKAVYIFDTAFDLIPAVIFAFTQSVPVFIIGILFTMLKDVFAPVSFAYFYDCFPDEKAVAVMGLNSSVGNACSFFAPLLVGAVWAYSPRFTFGIGAVSNLIAVLIAVFMLPNVKLE